MNAGPSFSKIEIERYSRQILIEGSAGQQRLKRAHVLVIGAGGLGSTLLPVLAASGVGHITLYDHDQVERTNLGRQLIYREADLGKNKALAAKAFLESLNPHVSITAHDQRFAASEPAAISGFDMIFEGSDSLSSKFALNTLALQARRPLVISSLGSLQGHTMLVNDPGNACYRCLFDEINESEIPRCASEGILSSFPAAVAAQAAHVIVQFLLGHGPGSGFWLFEKNHCRVVRVSRRTDCSLHNR